STVMMRDGSATRMGVMASATPSTAWTAMAAAMATWSRFTVSPSRVLRRCVDVQGELGHAQRFHQVDEMHDATVLDAPVGRDDGLHVLVALGLGVDAALGLRLQDLLGVVEELALPRQRQRDGGLLCLLAGGGLGQLH